jgi:hypothetical protein
VYVVLRNIVVGGVLRSNIPDSVTFIDGRVDGKLAAKTILDPFDSAKPVSRIETLASSKSKIVSDGKTGEDPEPIA